MDTTKVFTGFDNDDNEILIYRENNDLFIDLINKEKFNKEDLDLKTLRYLRDTVKLLRYLPKSLIVELYKIDRQKTLKSDDVLIGVKGNISSLEVTRTKSGFYLYGVPIYDKHYNWELSNREYGLYLYDKKIVLEKEYEYKLYKNLCNGKTYIGFNGQAKNICQIPTFANGLEYVSFADVTLKKIINESITDKKKVYEYANRLRKEKID